MQQHQVVNNGGGDNSNSSSQQKNKKERADNWSSAEIQVLHRGIETRRDVFYGPPNQATKKNRELAWEQIAKEVNSVSTTPRSLSQVMKKFKNEKCRAKRKFIDAEKDGHNNNNNINSNNSNSSSNNLTSVDNNTSTTNNNTSLSAQNHNTNSNNNNNSNNQIQLQQTTESMSNQPTSINVVKLAPQNVAKTMIDLPGHVQQIQIPNDDMVLIVPPEMDGLLSGMKIVSDGNGHHFQKCSGNSTLNNQQHNHHGQHTIQTINPGQALVNGAMSNGMMTRTIPAGSMCSLVYSTGGDVCSDQHIANSVSGPASLSSNHISVNTQSLMHHRGSVDQNQLQQQHQQHQQQQQQQQQSQHHHQPHQHQQQAQPQQQPTHQQQQPQHPHQTHQPAQHHSHHLQQNLLAPSTTTMTNTSGGVVTESQLKNLLFSLFTKEGQHTVPMVSSNPIQDHSKQRNDTLAIIASSLNKIEGHLSKISKVASTVLAQNLNSGSNDNGSISSSSLNNQGNSLNMNSNEGNNNNLNVTGTGGSNNINTQSDTET